MKLKLISTIAILAAGLLTASAETVEPIKFGNFDSWMTRIVPESHLLGGHKKTLYEIAPAKTVEGNIPYKPTVSPWATSNILANVVGIVKGSNAVFPDAHGSGKAAKLTTIMEHCKAIGLINVDVLVAGSIFLGEMIEPIKSSKNPYSKMEMGIPFTKRPKALRFDYKVSVPETGSRTYSSGFGKKRTIAGKDSCEVYIILQRRWEDSDGNIYAKRVGTGRERFTKSTAGWISNHDIPVKYGDITSDPAYRPWMGLIDGEKAYYARNSKGKMVPVHEVGWDAPDATPTHLLVMASASCGTAYIGTIDQTLWVDNMALVY